MADVKPIVKQLIDLEVKDAEKGEVEAVVATFGVVDGDGDVVRPDAIPDGASVKVSAYGHDVVLDRRAPVGMGTVTRRGSQAVFKGRMFLSTERGRETFTVLREMGKDQEWSFGYRVLGAEVPDDDLKAKGALRILTKLDAFEVSPVLRGAGVDTYTVAVKAAAVPDMPADDPIDAEAKALPEPGEDESHDDFISRCHAAIGDEFDDEEQRHAVCEERWQAQKHSAPDEADETKDDRSPDSADDPLDGVLARFQANSEYAAAIAAKKQAEEDLRVATAHLDRLEVKRRQDREEQKAIQEEFMKFEKTRHRLGVEK